MNPIEFKEQNLILQKPKEMTDEECTSLPCFTDGEQFVSKWELTEEEKKHILEHGFVWLQVLSNVHPPVSISACKTVFVAPNDVKKMDEEIDDIFKKGSDGNN
jgi:hypothetical protein